MKACLLTSTQLFILALTTACNQHCVYCQAGEVNRFISMSKDICQKAIDVAAES
jgi:MoaA/NifB/PqqE/SkfB family radical SAM enzyme